MRRGNIDEFIRFGVAFTGRIIGNSNSSSSDGEETSKGMVIGKTDSLTAVSESEDSNSDETKKRCGSLEIEKVILETSSGMTGDGNDDPHLTSQHCQLVVPRVRRRQLGRVDAPSPSRRKFPRLRLPWGRHADIL